MDETLNGSKEKTFIEIVKSHYSLKKNIIMLFLHSERLKKNTYEELELNEKIQKFSKLLFFFFLICEHKVVLLT